RRTTDRPAIRHPRSTRSEPSRPRPCPRVPGFHPVPARRPSPRGSTRPPPRPPCARGPAVPVVRGHSCHCVFLYGPCAVAAGPASRRFRLPGVFVTPPAHLTELATSFCI